MRRRIEIIVMGTRVHANDVAHERGLHRDQVVATTQGPWPFTGIDYVPELVIVDPDMRTKDRNTRAAMRSYTALEHIYGAQD